MPEFELKWIEEIEYKSVINAENEDDAREKFYSNNDEIDSEAINGWFQDDSLVIELIDESLQTEIQSFSELSKLENEFGHSQC